MLKTVVRVLLLAAALAAVMTAVRVWLVEPDEMAIRCTAERMASLTCRIRSWAIQGFSQHLFGPISIAAAVLGWIGGSSYLCILAMVVGMAGVAIFDFDLAAIGLLLGVLYLVQTPISQRQPDQPQT